MVDNKKIKLPQHLQLDSVSPATRLLEKRRAMYEVQKAFEDQKEEFRKKEERFKMRESELREKDILIQDHLIKFSTFLQQHEMKRKKDMELSQAEREKIREKEEEIERGRIALENLKTKAEKIKSKVDAMQKFEKFLERVKDEHPDEFPELHDIVSRYQTLQASNERLLKEQKRLTEELDSLNKQIAAYTKEMNTKKMTLNNKIATKQQKLEKIEDLKGRLMAESEENTSKKMKKTTEHGQILMTIDNLYQKCQQRKNLIISMSDIQGDKPKNFDNMQNSGLNALGQLGIIKQCLENFIRLKGSLDLKTHIKEEKQRKRENNEII